MTTQDTQILDESSMVAAVAAMGRDVEAKEKAAVAAHVFDGKASPLRPKRPLTATFVWEPSPKAPRSGPVKIKQEPIPTNKEAFREEPSKSLEKPPSKPLVHPVPFKKEPLAEEEPSKSVEKPLSKPLLDPVPIKKEPLEVPIKIEPGIKQELQDAPEAPETEDAQGPDEALAEPEEGSDAAESGGGNETANYDPNSPADPKHADDEMCRPALLASSPADPKHADDELPRPALLSAAGVVAPGDQTKLTKKAGKKAAGAEKDEPSEACPKAKKPAQKDEMEVQPKRKPGRPRKNEAPPKAKAKAVPEPSPKKAVTPKNKANKKRKAADCEVGSSQETKHYSPEPKAKAKSAPKAKAKAKASSKAKAAPPAPKARAGCKGGNGKGPASADPGLKSRKSCAYHKAKNTALKNGLSQEEAITEAKKVTWLNI